jgi:hypothetical protein
VCIVLFLILLSSASAEIQIISPEDQSETTLATLVTGWTNSAQNITQYRAQLSTDSFSTILQEIPTSNPYTTLRNLDEGTYQYRIIGMNGDQKVDESAPVSFTVHEIPDFSVTADLSEYPTSKIVVFTINAPLGSKIDIHAESSADEFSYHPESISTREFRTILEPGDYALEANLTYIDYTTSYDTTFDIDIAAPETEEDDDATTENTTNETASHPPGTKFRWDLQTFTSDGVALPFVDVTYHSLPKNASDAINGSITTDSGGKQRKLLEAGSYLVTFNKEGYQELNRLLELDWVNVSMEVGLTPATQTLTAEAVQAQSVTITKPLAGTESDGRNIVFSYQAEGTPTECQVLLSSGEGWNIEHTETEIGKENQFLKESLGPGTYKAKIKCMTDDTEFLSEEVSFTVKQPERDDSLTEEVYDLIDLATKKVNDLSNEQRKIVDQISLSERLEEARTTIDQVNEEYNQAIQNGASPSEIESLRSKVTNTIGQVKDSLPEDIIITNEENRAVYLPISGFDEVFEEYAALASPDADLPVKKYKIAQEDYMVRMDVKKITIKNANGEEERKTAVTEVVSALGGEDEYSVVLVIENGPQIEVMNPAERISNRFIKVTPSEDTVQYMFNDHVDLETAASVKTIVLTAINESSDTPTGMAIFDTSLGGSNTLFYMVIVFVTIVGVAGTAFLYSPKRVMKKRANALAQQIHKVMDHVENGRHNRAFAMMPKILERQASLSPEYLSEISPIMQHLQQELETHNLTTMISRLEEGIQSLAVDFDHKRYADFLKLYDSMMTSYNSMDDGLKTTFYEQVTRLYGIVKELEEGNDKI